MPDTFTPDEAKEFARLLGKLEAQNGWLPDTAYQPGHKAISLWAFELVITEWFGSIPKVLLSRYDGAGVPEHHNRFHIGGGFNRPLETIQQLCSRVGIAELGTNVAYKGVFGLHKWTPEEHPWGDKLLSIYAAVQPTGKINIDEAHRFFSLSEMEQLGPDDMVQNHPHRKFIRDYLDALEGGLSPTARTFGL